MLDPDCSITPDDWPHGCGFCWCGCGRMTKPARQTRAHLGHASGQPTRFINGHNGRRPLADRFWSKVTVGSVSECWEWQDHRKATGYGYIWVLELGQQAPAHRVAWELTRGPIPAGLEIDHLCRNRGCVNPAHLEPVSHQENVRRGTSPAAFHAGKTHCKHGHPYGPESQVRHRCQPASGKARRRCRVCDGERKRRSKHD